MVRVACLGVFSSRCGLNLWGSDSPPLAARLFIWLLPSGAAAMNTHAIGAGILGTSCVRIANGLRRGENTQMAYP